jgi:hypothetical protein
VASKQDKMRKFHYGGYKELVTEVGELERMEGVGELKVGVDRSK